ncbi:MAG: hypothetical protein D6776_10750 [Planctomycetota bacterium]|nr:MAG: hypothetical protein D6776_10750 [Planctomycetota bacterium]
MAHTRPRALGDRRAGAGGARGAAAARSAEHGRAAGAGEPHGADRRPGRARRGARGARVAPAAARGAALAAGAAAGGALGARAVSGDRARRAADRGGRARGGRGRRWRWRRCALRGARAACGARAPDRPDRTAPGTRAARAVRRCAFGLPLLAVALLALPGCYYTHLAAGQLRIACGKVDLLDAAVDGRLRPEERRMLREVPEILRFARRSLGMEADGAYTTFYDTGRRPVSYNVWACERTAFRPVLWRYPFVGALPYRGFFDLAWAKRVARRWRERGYDARITGVQAYSTLGWFDDPVLRSMMLDGEVSFVITLLHELAHKVLFRKGDAQFSESLATFVGEHAALAWFTHRDGRHSRRYREAQDQIADNETIARLMRGLYRELETLYAAGLGPAETLARRERVFARTRERIRAMLRSGELRSRRFAGLASARFDNCLVLGFRTYHTHQDRFAAAFAAAGGDWRAFWKRVREAAAAPDPFAALVRQTAVSSRVTARGAQAARRGVRRASAPTPRARRRAAVRSDRAAARR